ncbi:ATP-binding protein [Streptomyces albidoflavus]|uniref:ATP-binding protein n=1 Tax=Streptomyces albidoflavus TaxID=1886 RepID=UPI0033EDA4BF
MVDNPSELLPGRAGPLGGPPFTLVLISEPQSARSARLFVRQYLAYYLPGASDEHVQTVALVACELVTNAIRYGTGPGDSLRIVLDADEERTRVEVRDPVRRHPRRRPASEERERGRGLLLLDALCPQSWGVSDVPFGKTVWAEVSAKPSW